MAKRVLIVGSGIIGAAIAWHLAKGGAQVTVLDGSDAGGLATRFSWAWINAGWGNPEPYFRLRERAMLEWRRLDREVPGLTVNWCGGLLWDLPPDELEAYAKQHAAWGYGISRVNGAEILRIEPNLKNPPDFALHVAEEGVTEPLAAARAMLAGAEALGAKVIAHAHVKWLAEDGGRVAGVMTEEGTIHADEIVVAAGAGTVQLLDSIGIKLKLTTPPGLLAHSKPAGEMLRGLVMSPGLHVRQTAEGRLVAGTDFAGADPLDRPADMARGLHAKMQAMITGAEAVEFDFHTLGYRPNPADGFPAIGRPRNRAGLYIAVMHSGMTLAPVAGLFAARELLEETRDPLISLYHPDRPALA
ncbi:MAG: NAD(P)/FAD-dependent oxidoreductase [Hyphomicrobiales bacterium]